VTNTEVFDNLPSQQIPYIVLQNAAIDPFESVCSDHSIIITKYSIEKC